MTTATGNAAVPPLSEPFWDALRDGGFALQQCMDCGRRQHYPRLLCRHCHGVAVRWAPASPAGTVLATVTAHRTSNPQLRDRVPYPVLLVRLDDGPLMLATTAATAAVNPAAAAPAVPSEGAWRAGDRVTVDAAETIRTGRICVTSQAPGH